MFCLFARKCSRDTCSHGHNIVWILCALLWAKKSRTIFVKSNQTGWLFLAIHGEISVEPHLPSRLSEQSIPKGHHLRKTRVVYVFH